MKYVSGTASLDEMAEVALAIAEDPSLKELISILQEMNDNGTLRESDGALPAGDCAGAAPGNLCDILCERFILRDFLGENIPETEGGDNQWIKESGTPLHSMGRLLERYGMSVVRRYDCTADDILESIRERRRAIAVIDSGELWSAQANGLFHAVVCLSVTPDTIVVYDPAQDRDAVIKVFDPTASANVGYDFACFLKAWRHSHNYLVIASAEGLEYQPHPIDVGSMGLDEDLLELTEALAEDSHEVWAARRKAEGWSFGEQRNEAARQHPNLIPYAELPESEKEYDRESSMHTLQLVKKLGYDIHRKYSLYCPACGEFVSDQMHFCPNCGHKLNWDHLTK